ncbi:MATH domain and coiled-coil domain-containing protein At3g58370 [Arachis duranensis]|uniref:MATH domain and coiled-coil domain-containing protein At3g58370 n=1 Tax=Arachis duranensis TaxID=130453 RepID=A0A9C6TCB8_ARADU|nr:MATH domain and coiled-coil domain-containing protein At3g58370 [Arachis duranensis]
MKTESLWELVVEKRKKLGRKDQSNIPHVKLRWYQMENQEKIGETFETFKWTIKDLSKLNTKKLYSQNFNIGGHPWRILMYPKGNNVGYLSIYLDAGTLPCVETRFSKFKLVLINQVNDKLTQTKETQHTFNARESDWGFISFIPLADFYDHSKGFIVDDTCIIEAKISVSHPELEKKVDEAAPPISVQVPAKPIEHADNPLPMDISAIPIDELVDFRGLGKVEKAFVPLLDEVYAKHPSVIGCQKKRSRRFSEWAFTALGRVLHFLKTKKVRDMDEEACSHLQILWEELETFRFNLTWLEPHVQSALGMKNYMERSAKVKSVKENVAALEMEMKKLKAMVASVEVDLEMARRELVKVEEGFEEIDLDGELGYGP